MAGPGVIQAELSIELGRIAGQLNQAQALIANFAVGAGSAMKPANQAVDGLAKSIQNYKAAQVSQARTANYFTQELVNITGLSREAGSAVNGLSQIFLEAAAGGGAFAVGFEVAKFALAQLVGIFKAAEERTKALESAQLALNGAIMAGKYAFEALRRGIESEGDKAFRQVFDAATAGVAKFQEELEKIRPTTWGLVKAFIWDGSVGLKRMQEESDKAAAGLDKILASAKKLAEEARALAEMPLFGPGNDFGAGAFAINSERSAEANKKSADYARDELKWRAGIDALNKKVIESAKPIPSEVPTTLTQEERRGFTFDFAPVFGPGNTEGAFQFGEDTKKQIDLANQLRDVWQTVAGAVSNAFASVGAAVGGSLGEVLGMIGQVISQLIAMAIATQGSLPFPYNIVAMAATGAAMIAGMVSTMSQVPSYDVGTLSVPRTGLALVHQGEAILPADGTAQAYRSGRGGNVSITINAVDGPSVYRTLTNNRGDVARALREMARDS